MFPCTGCGLCCQNISHVEELVLFDTGNGVCKFFDASLKNCKIYDLRPDICRVDKMFEIKYFKHFSKSDFYAINAGICNQLQIVYGMEEKFRIKL